MFAALLDFDAVVLAGGGAQRLQGQDKPGLHVGARTMLETVLDACQPALRTIVVGPPRATVHPVIWTQEEPAGAGPVTAVRAGLNEVTADTVVLLPADLPFVTSEFVRWLVGHAPAVVVADGREQWLCSAWPTDALRHARPAGALRTFLGELAHEPITWPGDGTPWLDCDTPAELQAARLRAR